MKADNIEHRLVVLEEKIEYQEYTVEKLNEVIINQQQQLDTLETSIRRLGEKIDVSRLEIDGYTPK